MTNKEHVIYDNYETRKINEYSKPTLDIYKSGKTWMVREVFFPTYAKPTDIAMWKEDHHDIKYYPSPDDRNDVFYIGGPEYYEGIREASPEEVERHLKEVEAIKKAKAIREVNYKAKIILELRKKAKELGFNLVKIR